MRTLILLSLLGAAMAAPKSIQRIVGGSATTIEDYPFMSNLEFGWFGGIIWQQSCGGSLLTRFTVLTAAHCTFGDSPASWRVRLGSSNRSSGGVIQQVSRIINHEGYRNLDNDISLLILQSPVDYSATIQSCFIAGPNYNLPDGTPVSSIGWGDLTSGANQGSEQLQHVEINTINQQVCAERYAYLKTQPGYQNWPDITDSMLCAGLFNVGGADACQGDSGGPLAHDGNIVVGITSWGYGCGDAYYPGVNARVSYLNPWILSNAV